MESGERRTILKFDEDGVPYEQETEIPGIKPLRRKLTAAVRDGRDPLIVIGDICGMGTLNNDYGREVADSCILRALELFIEQFAGTGAAAGSPSGDEIWAVAHPGATPRELHINLGNYLNKIQSLEMGPDSIGMNARFLIDRGTDVFRDGEERLKYKDGEKLPPGNIRIDAAPGKLFSHGHSLSKKPLIIREKG